MSVTGVLGDCSRWRSCFIVCLCAITCMYVLQYNILARSTKVPLEFGTVAFLTHLISIKQITAVPGVAYFLRQKCICCTYHTSTALLGRVMKNVQHDHDPEMMRVTAVYVQEGEGGQLITPATRVFFSESSGCPSDAVTERVQQYFPRVVRMCCVSTSDKLRIRRLAFRREGDSTAVLENPRIPVLLIGTWYFRSIRCSLTYDMYYHM